MRPFEAGVASTSSSHTNSRWRCACILVTCASFIGISGMAIALVRQDHTCRPSVPHTSLQAPFVDWQSSKWNKRGITNVQATFNFETFKQMMMQASEDCSDLGISAVVFDVNGVQVLEHTVGNHYCVDKACNTAGEQWSADTVHAVFSGTKLVTAATFMSAAVATGKASLDEPFKSSLPDIFGVDGAHGGEATPRMVMSHTAGFPGLHETQSVTGCYSASTSLVQCVRQLASSSLQHRPGSQFEYSDLAWEVLGLLLERTTDLSIDAAFQHHIGRPMSMDSSSYNCPAANSSASRAHAGTGLCTSVRDMAKFIQMMYLRGQTPLGLQVLPLWVVEELFTGQTGGASLVGDEINFFHHEFNTRCISGVDGFNGSGLDYGFGSLHSLGFKSDAWMHGGSLGFLHFIAPGRYAAVFSTGYAIWPAVSRHLRALDAFESSNFPELIMCPASLQLRGKFPVPAALAHVPWNHYETSTRSLHNTV